MSNKKPSFFRGTSSSFLPKQLQDLEDASQEHSIRNSRVDSSVPNSPARKLSKIQANSFYPSRKQSGFIYLPRKKAVDFLMIENLLKQVQSFQRKPSSHALNIPPLDSTVVPIPVLGLGPVSLTPSPNNLENKPQVIEVETPPDPEKRRKKLIELKSKKMLDELISAGNSHAKISKSLSPLNPKNIFSLKDPGKDKTTELIKLHNHRIYGIDQFNLKKINTLLKAKIETPRATGSKNFQKFNINRKDTQLLAIDPNQLNEKEEEEPDAFRDYNIYEYNPLIDDFQFTGTNVHELEKLLKTLTIPKTLEFHHTNGSGFEESTRQKNQVTGNYVHTSTKSDLPIIPGLEAQSSRMNSQTNNLKPSGVMKFRQISFGDPNQGSKLPFFELNSDRYTKSTLFSPKAAHEGTTEEISKKIIAQTYRNHNEKNISKSSFVSVDNKMKNIEALCEKLEGQNKKIMKKFKKDKRKLGKDFNKLNKRVNSIMQNRVKDIVTNHKLQEDKNFLN